MIEIGSRVRVRADPTRQGVVVRSTMEDGRTSYLVFFGGSSESWWDEESLEFVPEELRIRATPRNEFLRRLASFSARLSPLAGAWRQRRGRKASPAANP
jgi:hypothetical protein